MNRYSLFLVILSHFFCSLLAIYSETNLPNGRETPVLLQRIRRGKTKSEEVNVSFIDSYEFDEPVGEKVGSNNSGCMLGILGATKKPKTTGVTAGPTKSGNERPGTFCSGSEECVQLKCKYGIRPVCNKKVLRCECGEEPEPPSVTAEPTKPGTFCSGSEECVQLKCNYGIRPVCNKKVLRCECGEEPEPQKRIFCNGNEECVKFKCPDNLHPSCNKMNLGCQCSTELE